MSTRPTCVRVQRRAFTSPGDLDELAVIASGDDAAQNEVMDADLETLLREVWADLRAQLDALGKVRSVAPAKPRREHEPIQLLELEDLDLSELESSDRGDEYAARLARIEARLTRLEKHLGLDE